MRTRPTTAAAFTLLVGSLLLTAGPALAGGTPENILLIIDPTQPDSLYVGNYYKNARNIPDENVLYFTPGTSTYASFAAYNRDALFGFLANAGTADHIDYVVLTPGAPYRISAANLVNDAACPAKVLNFSVATPYTLAFMTDEVLAGGLNVTNRNQFYASSPRAFDSETSYYFGSPSTDTRARRYFIAALLGYSGDRGNTPAETIAMIDRSVAADGTRPAGTFYFMNTTDSARNVRYPQFAGAQLAIEAIGGQAEILDGSLPTGRHDCLGIMTGVESPPFTTADITILPGAFGDHLTSWAAYFGIAQQTKVSEWIRQGTSGSYGTIEEPCNYPGKFPHADFHYHYFSGCSLGEAALRSLLYLPFQGLLYGDPMTRPFAYLPTVDVPDAPSAPVSGAITLTPTATTTHPTAAIAGFDLLVDGMLLGTADPNQALTVDTTRLSDGWHDVRVLAHDDTLIQSTGRWVGALVVNNLGRSVGLNPTPQFGNWTTPFTFAVTATNAPREVRVLQNGRVLAAGPGASGTFVIYGQTLGAGPVLVQAEALYDDGTLVRGEPIELSVSYASGTPTGNPPTAFGYTKFVRKDGPFVVELPATFDDPNTPVTYEIVTPPAMATVPSGQTGPYRLMNPNPDAPDTDTFTFRATSAVGDSAEVTVNLVYDWWVRGDLNCDGAVNFGDINPFVLALIDPTEYAVEFPDCNILNADLDGNGSVSFGDINPFVALLVGGTP